VIDLAICFAFIKSLSSAPRHAAFVKREAFFALGDPADRRGSQDLNKLSQIMVSAIG
jgi:hypothetical protein